MMVVVVVKKNGKKMGYSLGYSSASTLMFVCCLEAACHSVISQQGVNLLWQGVQYPNNSILNIEGIGEGEHALICQTDKRPCCRTLPHRFGEWYYPNGSKVPIKGVGALFYRNRSDEGIVQLNRRNHEADYSTGLFCCVLPDTNDTKHTLCAGLLPIGNIGDASIDSVFYNMTSFTLSCVTSGGIATYINRDDCDSKRQLINISQQVLDPLTMRYNNILKWCSQNQSNYVCSTRNSVAASYAVLLTEFGVGQRSCSSQVVGIQGHELILLCLANEPVTSAVWTKEGVRYSNNITFAHLSLSDTGKYICQGTIRNQVVSSVVDLKISRCNAVVYANGIPAIINITQSYRFSCNTFQWETGCPEEEYYFYHGNRMISRNQTFTFRADSVSDVLNDYFYCVVTLNGSNFTSNPVQTPHLIQLSPLSVSISSDMENPIPHGSSPTLFCTVSLPPAIDIPVEIVIEWNGPTYGLREYTTTAPVLNSSAEVPTFTSTATLNASGTFYDSGEYYCSVVFNPLILIQSISAVASPRISVLFLYPHRPMLHSINQRGFNWIYISWDGNRAADNITEYEVEYSYAGDCAEINEGITRKIVIGNISLYNITDLSGEYLNYTIFLTAVNDTGRSPPNIKFALTLPTIPTEPPQAFVAVSEFSTNITVKWQRVRCTERRSEITHYFLQYSLEGSDRVMEERVLGTSDKNRMHMATRLQPLSRYKFTIAAVNSNEKMGPNVSVIAMTSTPESVPFQLPLIGVHSCLQWRISDPEEKVHDVLIGISSGVNERCPHCELEHTNITDGEFQCFPGSPNQVTFRGKVHDRAQATAREVITYIEQWITSLDMVTLPVHHARFRINTTCVVLLASLYDPECPGYLTPPSQLVHTTTYTTSDMMISDSNSISELTTAVGNLGNKRETLPPVDMKQQPQSDAGAIVGGTSAVAIVLIITAGVVMMFLIYSIFKLKHVQIIKQSISKELDESAHKVTAPVKPAAVTAEIEEDTTAQDEIYEVVEMQVTSTDKTRFALAAAQIPRESTRIQPVKSETSKNSPALQEENQEAYVNID